MRFVRIKEIHPKPNIIIILFLKMFPNVDSSDLNARSLMMFADAVLFNAI